MCQVWSKRPQAKQLFQAFVQGQCYDQAYTATHEGHRSHVLWQKGNKVNCTQCGLSLHLDAQQRIILTTAIKKPCKGAGLSGSPPLEEIFRRQATQASPQSPDDSASGSSQTSPQAPQAVPISSKKPRLQFQQLPQPPEPHPKGDGPTPRRLHFPTKLDQQAHGSLALQPERALTPSQPDPLSALTSEDTPEATSPGQPSHDGEDTSFTVDYF